MKWILPIVAGLAFTTHAEIYKCDVNGVTTFSQDPCGDDAQVVTIVPPQTMNSGGLSRDDVIQACLKFLTSTTGFKDAESVRLEGHYEKWGSDKSGARHIMVLMINAKNSYGGYSGSKPFNCFLNHAGDSLSSIQHFVN